MGKLSKEEELLLEKINSVLDTIKEAKAEGIHFEDIEKERGNNCTEENPFEIPNMER